VAITSSWKRRIRFLLVVETGFLYEEFPHRESALSGVKEVASKRAGLHEGTGIDDEEIASGEDDDPDD